ncbi:MAG TPA: LysR substrate-binding domain-containing protein, partial [Burkholderiaceae bacterium]|nr:LysR substrate-binding domain-containing protein [Burkholderiaceae bacterium]
WAFQIEGKQVAGADPATGKVAAEVTHLKPGGPLDCSDGQVLHDWCLAGYGIAWRSTWEVEAEIASGQLAVVLEEFAAPPNGIYAVFPQRKHLPLRVRLWIDFLKHNFSQPGFWKRAGSQQGAP